MIDLGDIVGAEPSGAVGGVEVFPAELDAQHLVAAKDVQHVPPAVVQRLAQTPPAMLVLRIVRGIRQPVELASDHGLRLVALGDGDRFEPPRPLRHVDVPPEEVIEVRPQHQDLRHPGVVVVAGRDVAVGAGLRLGGPHGVRHERAEGVTGEALGGDRLLL